MIVVPGPRVRALRGPRTGSCAGHQGKPARRVPRPVDDRAKPGQDDWV